MKRQPPDYGRIPISAVLEILEFYTFDLPPENFALTNFFGYFRRLLPVRVIHLLFPSIQIEPFTQETPTFVSSIPILKLKHLVFSQPCAISPEQLESLENLTSLHNIQLANTDTLFGLSVLFQIQSLSVYLSPNLLQHVKPKEILEEYLSTISRVRLYIPRPDDFTRFTLMESIKPKTSETTSSSSLQQSNNINNDDFSRFFDNKAEEEEEEIDKKKKKKKKRKKRKKRTRKFLRKREGSSTKNRLRLYEVEIPPEMRPNIISYTLRKKIGDAVELNEVICDVRLRNNRCVYINSPVDGVLETIYKSSKHNRIVKDQMKRERDREEVEGESESSDESENGGSDPSLPLKVASVRGCKHEEILNRLCLLCNKRVRLNNISSNKGRLCGEEQYIPYQYGDNRMLVQREHAIKMEEMERAKSESQKKLILVLDLDLTLIHCTLSNNNIRSWMKNQQDVLLFDDNVPQTTRTKKKKPENNNNKEEVEVIGMEDEDEEGQNVLSQPGLMSLPRPRNQPEIFTFQLYGQKHHMKKRPHLDWFLSSLDPLFRFHVFTHGTRLYAKKVAQFIDPTRSYFSDRLVTRDDDENVLERKSLRYKFPSDQSRILIVDDNENVWKGPEDGEDNRMRLLRITPYMFFSKKDLVGDWKEKDVDDQLVILYEKLVKIHSMYWKLKEIFDGGSSNTNSPSSNVQKMNDDDTLNNNNNNNNNNYPSSNCNSFLMKDNHVDVADLLKEEKRKVFKGCKLCFSGLVPREIDAFFENRIITKAMEFGAEVVVEVSESVTHLVVSSNIPDFTEKIKKVSESRNTMIVNHNWLFESVKFWRRMDEEKYPLKIKDKILAVKRQQNSIEGLLSQSENNNQLQPEEKMKDEDEDEAEDEDEKEEDVDMEWKEEEDDDDEEEQEEEYPDEEEEEEEQQQEEEEEETLLSVRRIPVNTTENNNNEMDMMEDEEIKVLEDLEDEQSMLDDFMEMLERDLGDT